MRRLCMRKFLSCRSFWKIALLCVAVGAPSAPILGSSGGDHGGDHADGHGAAEGAHDASSKKAAEGGTKHREPAKSSKKQGRPPRMGSEAPPPVVLPPPTPVNAEDILEIKLLEPTEGPLAQGALTTFRFLVRNPTEDVVMLREIVSESPEDPPLEFVISGYGTVAYNDKIDAYLYDPTVQQATPRIFHHGVLLPGEARRIELTLRVLRDQHTVAVRYNLLPADAFRRIAFVPLEGGEGREVTFQHLQTLPAGHLKPRPVPDGPIQERPFILWEDLHPAPVPLVEQKFTQQIPLKSLAMSGEQAVAQAALKGTPTWWAWGGGWVIIGERSSMLVRPDGGKRPLPRVDARLFRDIDGGKAKVRVKLTVGGEVFKNRFVSREGDGMYTFGDFIEVPRERLWEFFDLARGENFELTRETYLFDAYYFVLTPLP